MPREGSFGAATPVIYYGRAAELTTAWSVGCADYIKDPWTPKELHFRVERVLSSLTSPLRFGEISLKGFTLSCTDSSTRLSAQERSILELLIRYSGRAVARETFYYSIWGKPGGASRTVDVHIARLRAKLAALQTSVAKAERVRLLSMRGEGYGLWTGCE